MEKTKTKVIVEFNVQDGGSAIFPTTTRIKHNIEEEKKFIFDTEEFADFSPDIDETLNFKINAPLKIPKEPSASKTIEKEISGTGGIKFK